MRTRIKQWIANIATYFLLIVTTLCCDPGTEHNPVLQKLPDEVAAYIDSISLMELGNYKPVVRVKKIDEGMINVRLTYNITDTLKQTDWRLDMTPAFKPSFYWSPHLTPTDDHIIAQHVFRAPAVIMSGEEKLIAVMPDIGLLQKGSPVKWYMDMDALKNKITLGLSNYKVKEHVLFTRDDGAVYPPGKFEFGFNIVVSDEPETVENPWRKILAFYWKNYGGPLYRTDGALPHNLDPYVSHTYNWAFNRWKDAVWQEFELNGKIVGAPVFIVNVTQSPNYPGERDEREFRSIWNQAWFSSLRSASGLYRYARRTGNDTLLEKARMTKELALSFPQRDGFFEGLIATEMEEVEVEGKKSSRSKGWDAYYYGNSNRNPLTHDPKTSPLHILDMSWTAYLMLKWNEELEEDKRLVDYAERYARALLKLQRNDGHFPAWLNKKTLQPVETLARSPETSMSVTFLLEMYRTTNDTQYKEVALKAMQAVLTDIVPAGRWEDFETYWSCSRFGHDTHVGKKFKRNNMYKQNNFSMYWTAEALLNCYRVTGNEKYLRRGQRTLDELLMTQATWQPPYMYVRTLGGFGVMNADAEWNDSRQSLFSELIVDYGKALGSQEYIERGLAALRASFVMMYCPENPLAKKQWENKWSFFGKEDYGFMMENYGHDGYTNNSGGGMGTFTIYDWGNGAAAEAYNRMVDHYGKTAVENGLGISQ